MWVFISSQIRRWLIFAVVVPLVTTGVHVARVVIERRYGQSRLTRALNQVENLGRQQNERRRQGRRR